MSSIGQKIARLREEQGWTLKALSQKSGVSLSHISAIENGTRPNPSILRIVKLAKAFGVSLAYFDDLTSGGVRPAKATESGDGEVVAVSRATGTPATQELAAKLQTMYDAKTQAFFVAESSKPYVDLAMQLAAQNPTQDPSVYLQLIAQFIRDQNPPYKTD